LDRVLVDAQILDVGKGHRLLADGPDALADPKASIGHQVPALIEVQTDHGGGHRQLEEEHRDTPELDRQNPTAR
jgi:hypothetical protein